MLITLVFSDISKQYDLDITQFPTIADYVELAKLFGSTGLNDPVEPNKSIEFQVPEYFESSSMDFLIKLLNNETKINEINYLCNDVEYVNINYIDLLFSEYLGVNLFDVKLSKNNEYIIVDLNNLSKDRYTLLEKYNSKVHEGMLVVQNSDVTISGIALYKRKMKHNSLRNGYPTGGVCIFMQDDVEYYTSKLGTDDTGVVYFYISRLNVVWNNVDWTLIEKFYNNQTIRSSLSLSTVEITAYDDDITVQAKLNIIKKLEEDYIPC